MSVRKGLEKDADKYEKQYKVPTKEVVDTIFCSVDAPCEQTVTVGNHVHYLRDQEIKAQEEYNEKMVETLFCSSEECKKVKPFDIARGKWEWPKSKTDEGFGELEKVEIPYVETKVSLRTKIRNYLSRQWQQKISMLQRNLTGQKSN